MKKIRLLTVATIALGFASAASAAESSANPADICKGRVEIFRISTITPKGTMAGFLKAAADHEAWFKSHGYAKDIFAVAREFAYDKEKKTFALSESEVVTVHIDPSQVPMDKQDDGYKTFVNAYRDNSDITTEKFVCAPGPAK